MVEGFRGKETQSTIYPFEEKIKEIIFRIRTIDQMLNSDKRVDQDC